VSRGAEESFTLSTSQEDELLAAVSEIERGDFVELEELLASLPQLR
jgi:hypothetical protein